MSESAFRAITRRRFVVTVAAGSAAAAALTLLPDAPAQAQEASKKLEDAIKKAIGDKQPADGAGVIALDVPQIAENGNTVPLGIAVESPMAADNYVKTVHLFADGNPSPGVIAFHFTPKSGKAEAATRMRLAKTQNVVALAEMSDGKVLMTKAEVKVTIGGCGG
ncbi:thiosulfate-binding protein SoxY [Tistlia consotensis]|uniref:Thiosulfate-binding protein SoxY n=1 Tax=Tistlia consotensis USBA 355 TaxID=560819 RepID=A0A1Y6B5R2_9PROT|nr:thiosulfate oxidation carrier protein SoxY [Tistlia consotensis]SME89143.1 thiosulfate-binding protein SoxY [Tistlia consotensis USBA 355]SNR25708.1 thiosulfate-binding protein SoxY [Tistlia consotensis]